MSKRGKDRRGEVPNHTSAKPKENSKNMNSNKITREQFIALIILKVLSEKLKQNNKGINNNFKKKKESSQEIPLDNMEEISRNKSLDIENSCEETLSIKDEEKYITTVQDEDDTIEGIVEDTEQGIAPSYDNLLQEKEDAKEEDLKEGVSIYESSEIISIKKDSEEKRENSQEVPLDNIDEVSENESLDTENFYEEPLNIKDEEKYVTMVQDEEDTIEGIIEDTEQRITLSYDNLLQDKKDIIEEDLKERVGIYESSEIIGVKAEVKLLKKDINSAKDYVDNDTYVNGDIIYKSVEYDMEPILDISHIITEDTNYSIKNPLEEKKIDNEESKDIKKTIVCNSKSIVKSSTLLNCSPSERMEWDISLEPRVSKIPVVLCEIEVPIFIEATEKFSEPVFKIISLDKKVVLKKCQLVVGTDKLFITGVIEESIEYATARCIHRDSVKGNIKKLAMNIPFKCSTKVSLKTKPVVSKGTYFIDLESFEGQGNNIDTYEKSYKHLEYTNDKVFCNLNSAKLLETGNQGGIEVLKDTLQEAYTFEKVDKKVILILNLTLLQNQYVFNYNNIRNASKE
ncbi:hypothetical protein KQI89_10760 [Clostridium sp. MSJ-4]|uniref:Uncharacterized protein n=1 Tax=Clostridium simiarum TaxID=2841506 RepID=A0ABS6F173_9CLOT|nr:hypothetical protein [Clostridium simiarum]MBU5592243.1 hypothetical protein [Clostridium simiarum]